MNFIDVIIVLAFIAQAIYSGFRSKTRASQNLTEYLLAGRSLKGWKAGISMAATQYAADTPLLVTGLIVTSGIAGLWRLWIYALAFLMMGYLLGKAWRKAGVITDAEFTEIRYSGNAVLLLRGLKGIYYGTIIIVWFWPWFLLQLPVFLKYFFHGTCGCHQGSINSYIIWL